MSSLRRSARLQEKQQQQKQQKQQFDQSTPAPGASSTRDRDPVPGKKRASKVDPSSAKPDIKRRKVESPSIEPTENIPKSWKDAVQHWTETFDWPSWYATMSAPPSNKRQRGYSQDSKDGTVPPAHSARSQKLLRDHGIDLAAAPARVHLSEDSKKLCDEYLIATHDECIPNIGFPPSKLDSVLDILDTRTEPRIVRDLTPLLVPSAENLILYGELESANIREEVGDLWTTVTTMGGPIPRPDLTVGLNSTAFTSEELRKLQNHRSPNHITMVTNDVYFPFLICEVKCSQQPFSRAGRQCGHGGAIAAKAIYSLHRTSSREKAEELNGKILGFSIAHDHKYVEIYAHFTRILPGELEPTIYRYCLHAVNITLNPEKEIKKVRDFVKEVYAKFYIKHLERIQSALILLPSPESKTEGVLGKDADKDPDKASMPPPSLSLTQMLQRQLEQQKQEHQREMRQNQLEMEQRKQEMEQQKQEMEQLQQQLQQEREQQMEQNRERMEQQREQVEQQREQVEQQREQVEQLQQMLQQVLQQLPRPGAGGSAT